MQSLWMLFASFMFTIMGVCVKLASDHYSTPEIIMYRGLVGLIFMFFFIKVRRGAFRTSLPLQHLWRGAVGVSALCLWFYAIAKLPLATAVTLNYMAPIWMAAILFGIGWWRGENRFEWGLASAIAVSFAGVLLLLRPAVHADLGLAFVAGLVSGVMTALAYLQVRRLSQLGEPEYRIVFYFSLTSTLTGLAFALSATHISDGAAMTWHSHGAKGIALLLGVGVSATVAQMAMTRAYHLGKTLVSANLQYSGIVFSSIWGILIWGDVLNWMGWLGMTMILVSGLAATFYNARSVKPATGKIASDPIASET
jgi:S-adenosylmethionine uptake transporter